MDPMDEDTPVAAASSSRHKHARHLPALSPSSASTPTSAGPQSASSASALGVRTTGSSSSTDTPAARAGQGRGHGQGEGQDAHSLSKRRRGVGIVTANACTECRKKRAKCDGKKPCTRCQNLDVPECVYEVPIRQSKEHLRAEIESLKRQQRSSDLVLGALSRPDVWEEVLARIRSGQTADSISDWLGGVMQLRPGGTSFAVPHSANQPSASASLASTPGLPPISTFAPHGRPSYAPASAGLSHTDDPGLSHDPQHSRQGHDPTSPWGHFASSHSQATGGGDSNSELLHWAGGKQNRQMVGTWLDDESGSDNMTESRFSGLEMVLTPELPEMKVPAGAWTKVTDDSRLVQHLLALYFCWEYPTFASLSKEHFLKDFQDGRTRYCSSILVNALLALGCRFSKHPTTRENPDDPYTSGDHFFKESLRLYHEEEDHCRLTTIQALGIMSIREASRGRDSESWYYAGQSIRLALEMGLQQTAGNGENDEQATGDGDDDDEVSVRAATFWGAYSLDLAWCLATGTLPQCSLTARLPPKPAIINDIEASLWIPYTDNGAPLHRSCEQPSNVRSVYKCFCELSELVHRSLYILHAPGRPVNSRELQNIYTEYLGWYNRVPDVLRLGHNFTPAVLFAHMYYHFAILLLFRPFIKLRIIDSRLLPRIICLQAADAIQSLTRSYSQLYTLRRTPSFVPYFILTSCIMHVTVGASRNPATARSPPTAGDPAAADGEIDRDIAASISRGIADLKEMAPCHLFAEQALSILLYLAKKWNLDIRLRKGSDGDGLAQPTEPGRGGLRPATDSMNFFVPEVREGDMMCSWGPVGHGRGTMGGALGEAPDTQEREHPLFWPFPMQGRPLLPEGDKLREAGFEMEGDQE